MNERLHYIDFLKGVGIVLVVMGHVLSWNVIDYAKPLQSFEFGYLLRDLIYTFHMPLFFFLAGLVLDIKSPHWDLTYAIQFIHKKIQTLVLPALTCVAFYYFIFGSLNISWFLRTLFELSVLYGLVRLLTSRFEVGVKGTLAVFVVLECILYVCYKKLAGTVIDDYIDLLDLRWHLIWYITGWAFCRLNIIPNVIQGNNADKTASISLTSFVVMFYLWYHNPGLPNLVLFPISILCASSAICYLLYISNNIRQNKLYACFEYLGKKSLFIYLYSNIFIYRNPFIGNLYFAPPIYNSLLIQFVSSVMLSALCIILVLGLERIVCSTSVTRFLFTGSIK